jgi:hypothetical protein
VFAIPLRQVEELAESDRAFISDDYKREVIEKMSVSQLVDTVMINPTVRWGGWFNVNSFGWVDL